MGSLAEAVAREGKHNEVDGMVGMDCEEGGRGVVSSSLGSFLFSGFNNYEYYSVEL